MKLTVLTYRLQRQDIEHKCDIDCIDIQVTAAGTEHKCDIDCIDIQVTAKGTAHNCDIDCIDIQVTAAGNVNNCDIDCIDKRLQQQVPSITVILTVLTKGYSSRYRA